MGEYKTYKRSDKCVLVHVPVAFNILDEEQKKDLDFVYAAPNRSGRVKECVRAMRLGMLGRNDYTFPADIGLDAVDDDDLVSEDDVLNSLIE